MTDVICSLCGFSLCFCFTLWAMSWKIYASCVPFWFVIWYATSDISLLLMNVFPISVNFFDYKGGVVWFFGILAFSYGYLVFCSLFPFFFLKGGTNGGEQFFLCSAVQGELLCFLFQLGLKNKSSRTCLSSNQLDKNMFSSKFDLSSTKTLF